MVHKQKIIWQKRIGVYAEGIIGAEGVEAIARQETEAGSNLFLIKTKANELITIGEFH